MKSHVVTHLLHKQTYKRKLMYVFRPKLETCPDMKYCWKSLLMQIYHFYQVLSIKFNILVKSIYFQRYLFYNQNVLRHTFFNLSSFQPVGSVVQWIRGWTQNPVTFRLAVQTQPAALKLLQLKYYFI